MIFQWKQKKKVLLFQQIQKCRENLSVNPEIDIKLESFYKDKDFIVKLSRDKLEGLTFHLLEIFLNEFHSFFNTCKNILNQNKIDHIEMVGGLVRTPLIEYYLTKISGIKLSKTNLVDECTAVGASLFNFYNNWSVKKEKCFPIKGFKQIIGYNYENIYYEIIGNNTLDNNNFNQLNSTPFPNLKEINNDNKNTTFEIEKGCSLPKFVNLKLIDNNNFQDNSQIISFFRIDNKKKIILINYKIFLPTSSEVSNSNMYNNRNNKNQSQVYIIKFSLNHCGYMNIYKIYNKKNEEIKLEYSIENQELIDDYDLDDKIEIINEFLNKIESIDKDENIIQEEKNKLSSLFYEQRNLIRSGSLEKLKLELKSIEKDLRNLNKISDKNDVRKGIINIKEKLNNVKRSVSQHTDRKMISKSVLDYEQNKENEYYKKRKRKSKKETDWTPNIGTFKDDNKELDNSFIKSSNINSNKINYNKNKFNNENLSNYSKNYNIPVSRKLYDQNNVKKKDQPNPIFYDKNYMEQK